MEIIIGISVIVIGIIVAIVCRKNSEYEPLEASCDFDCASCPFPSCDDDTIKRWKEYENNKGDK